MKKKSDWQDTPTGAFAALAPLRGTLPEGPAPQNVDEVRESPFGGKILITRERKGRGGKTVTLVRGIGLEGEALETLGRDMRQGLGTGGGLEGDAIVLHGDQSSRVQLWLAERGARRIVRGS